jgi:hypothetical protein
MSYEEIPITQEYLREILDYNPETGLFIWKINRGRLCKKGNIAGSIDSWGHLQICINSRKRLAHRLAWLYVYGTEPKQQIDHIDGNKQNNAISNLRDVNQTLNQQNRTRARKDSSSGLMGVIKDGSKYKAQIKAHKKTFYLGMFQTAQEAFEAYKQAKLQLHGIAI